MDWRQRAACRKNFDAEAFFLNRQERSRDRRRVEAAETLCGLCPVKRECAENRPPYACGLWGGQWWDRRGNDVGEARQRRRAS